MPVVPYELYELYDCREVAPKLCNVTELYIFLNELLILGYDPTIPQPQYVLATVHCCTRQEVLTREFTCEVYYLAVAD